MPHVRPERTLAQLASAAVALVLLAAGCGGSGRLSKAQYEKKVQAEARMVRATTNLGNGADLDKRLKATRDVLERTADDLDSVRPPKEVAGDNRKLVAGFRDVVDSLDRVRRAGTPAREREELRTIGRSKAATEAEAALKDMRRKGYDLGLFGRGA